MWQCLGTRQGWAKPKSPAAQNNHFFERSLLENSAICAAGILVANMKKGRAGVLFFCYGGNLVLRNELSDLSL
jgi:hypothetical protein